MTYQQVMSRRTVSIPETDDAAMVALADSYGCTVTQVYQRAVALYILTQNRNATFDVWPGAEPGDPPVTWSGEGV